jgi:hypothetical protein
MRRDCRSSSWCCRLSAGKQPLPLCVRMMYIPRHVVVSGITADGRSWYTGPSLNMYPAFLPQNLGSVISEKVLPLAVVLSNLPPLHLTVAAAQPTCVSLIRRPASLSCGRGSFLSAL